MRRLWARGLAVRWGLLFVLLCLCAPLAAQPAVKAKQIWRRKVGFLTGTADPLAADLNLDRRLEIVQVGVKHYVAAYDAETGRRIWKQDLGEYTLLAPVAGHFWLGIV